MKESLGVFILANICVLIVPFVNMFFLALIICYFAS